MERKIRVKAERNIRREKSRRVSKGEKKKSKTKLNDQSAAQAAFYKSNQPHQMVWKIRIDGCVKCGRFEIEFSC